MSARSIAKMLNLEEIEEYLRKLPKEVVYKAFSLILFQLYQNDVIVGTGKFEDELSETAKLDFSLLIKKYREDIDCANKEKQE